MVLNNEVENWECPPICNAALFQVMDRHLDAFPEAACSDREAVISPTRRLAFRSHPSLALKSMRSFLAGSAH